jgi:hypothetical protein
MPQGSRRDPPIPPLRAVGSREEARMGRAGVVVATRRCLEAIWSVGIVRPCSVLILTPKGVPVGSKPLPLVAGVVRDSLGVESLDRSNNYLAASCELTFARRGLTAAP